jgi:hypothetical protein
LSVYRPQRNSQFDVLGKKKKILKRGNSTESVVSNNSGASSVNFDLKNKIEKYEKFDIDLAENDDLDESEAESNEKVEITSTR